MIFRTSIKFTKKTHAERNERGRGTLPKAWYLSSYFTALVQGKLNRPLIGLFPKICIKFFFVIFGLAPFTQREATVNENTHMCMRNFLRKNF